MNRDSKIEACDCKELIDLTKDCLCQIVNLYESGEINHFIFVAHVRIKLKFLKYLGLIQPFSDQRCTKFLSTFRTKYY